MDTRKNRGSNEYIRSMFIAKLRKDVQPCKPQFYYIHVKVVCEGVKFTRACHPVTVIENGISGMVVKWLELA